MNYSTELSIRESVRKVTVNVNYQAIVEMVIEKPERVVAKRNLVSENATMRTMAQES
jgi:hypothetical protein